MSNQIDQEQLLFHLLANFRNENRGLFGGKIMPGDAKKSLAQLAAKEFRDVTAYRQWLTDPHPALGGRTPASLLSQDPDNLDRAEVKNLLLMRTLEREGYLNPVGQLELVFQG